MISFLNPIPVPYCQLLHADKPVIDGQFCNEFLIGDIKRQEHVSMTILRTKFLLFSVYLWYIVTYACET